MRWRTNTSPRIHCTTAALSVARAVTAPQSPLPAIASVVQAGSTQPGFAPGFSFWPLITESHSMSTENRVTVDVVIDSFTEHLRLPRKFVRQVIAAEKAADRIASAKPISPPMTPRAIARIVLALTAHSVGRAVETEKVLGALRYQDGAGQLNPEDEITDVVEASVGWRYRDDIDWRDGTVLVAHDDLTVFVGDSRFAAKDSKVGGMSKFTKINFAALAAIARDLLPNERGVA